MKYIKYTYTDAVTGQSIFDTPAANGPANPQVPGIEFGFAAESEYPTNYPTFYGTAPDTSSLEVPGVLGELTGAEYQAALDAETLAREAKVRSNRASQIAARRYAAEVSGITVEGMPIATDRDSNSLITGAALAASLDPSYSVQWKTSDGFVTLSAAQILGLASAVRARVQACFNREAVLLGAVADGTITSEMLEEGWPV